jgi:phosphatidylserine/phosphatidylglycerophosphate/cardiolipin synthase-like enzyme
VRELGTTLFDELVYEDVEVDDRRSYIHTKVTIVDDVWATIGSANINVRSHTGDSEINCDYIDGRADERGLRISVRDLRRQLWAEHVGFQLSSIPLEAGNHPDGRPARHQLVTPGRAGHGGAVRHPGDPAVLVGHRGLRLMPHPWERRARWRWWHDAGGARLVGVLAGGLCFAA